MKLKNREGALGKRKQDLPSAGMWGDGASWRGRRQGRRELVRRAGRRSEILRALSAVIRLGQFVEGGKEGPAGSSGREGTSPEGPTEAARPAHELLPKPLSTSSRWSPEDREGEDQLRHSLEG